MARTTHPVKKYFRATLYLWAIPLLVMAAPAKAELSPLELKGQALYAVRCAACHSVDYNGVGPSHKKVFGRNAGVVKDYVYSPALKASKIVWNELNLDRWLTNPEALVPGQKMGIVTPDAGERAELIAYLKSVSR